MGICRQCGKKTKKVKYLYCSNKCQLDFQYRSFILKWKAGKVSGGRGIRAKNISEHVRRYLIEKYRNGCVLCGWNVINPTLGRAPLEIDHIDGDSENSSESNLRLLCPNCHALTPNFRNLNKGSGRSWRRKKYVKVVQ